MASATLRLEFLFSTWKSLVALIALVAIGCGGTTVGGGATRAADNLPQTAVASDTAHYSNQMKESLTQLLANISELGQLLTNPLPDDDAWHSEVRQRLEMLVKTRDEVATIAPPQQFKDAHKSLMEALELYAEGAELGLAGLETDRGEMLILAASKFETAKSFIVLSTLQIKDAKKGEPSTIPGR